MASRFSLFKVKKCFKLWDFLNCDLEITYSSKTSITNSPLELASFFRWTESSWMIFRKFLIKASKTIFRAVSLKFWLATVEIKESLGKIIFRVFWPWPTWGEEVPPTKASKYIWLIIVLHFTVTFMVLYVKKSSLVGFRFGHAFSPSRYKSSIKLYIFLHVPPKERPKLEPSLNLSWFISYFFSR